jgi:hypothetical protein
MENGKPAKRRLTEKKLLELERRYESIFHAESLLKNFDVEVRITRKGESSPFPDKETMLIGWDEIGEFLGLHPVNVINQFGDKLRRSGTVFYKKVQRAGSKQRRRCVCSFPSLILAWCVRETLERRQREERLKLVKVLESCR